MKSASVRALVILFSLVLIAPALMAQIPVTDDALTSSASPTSNYAVSLGLMVQSPMASGSRLSSVEGRWLHRQYLSEV